MYLILLPHIPGLVHVVNDTDCWVKYYKKKIKRKKGRAHGCVFVTERETAVFILSSILINRVHDAFLGLVPLLDTYRW